MHPLDERAKAAIVRFREDGGGEHLRLLERDGLREVAHALRMERVFLLGGDRGQAARYTAIVEEWLAAHPG